MSLTSDLIDFPHVLNFLCILVSPRFFESLEEVTRSVRRTVDRTDDLLRGQSPGESVNNSLEIFVGGSWWEERNGSPAIRDGCVV